MSNKKNDGKAHIYMKDGEVYVTIDGEVFYWGSWNTSSTVELRVFAIFNASTVDGTYTPFSIALILTLDTPALSESSCWVMPADILSFSRLFESFLWFLPTF